MDDVNTVRVMNDVIARFSALTGRGYLPRGAAHNPQLHNDAFAMVEHSPFESYDELLAEYKNMLVRTGKKK